MPQQNFSQVGIDPFQRPKWIVDKLEQEICGLVVVDIGCGTNPHHRATFLYDKRPAIRGAVFYDAETQPIPLDHCDYVICTHVLEDLNNPFLLLEELRKKAPRGYIETPSIFHELCFGIDKGMPYRGHPHHRWFVWVEDRTLCLLPKLPIIDYRVFEAQKQEWNTTYFWNCDFQYRVFDVSPLLTKAPYDDYVEFLQKRII